MGEKIEDRLTLNEIGNQTDTVGYKIDRTTDKQKEGAE